MIAPHNTPPNEEHDVQLSIESKLNALQKILILDLKDTGLEWDAIAKKVKANKIDCMRFYALKTGLRVEDLAEFSELPEGNDASNSGRKVLKLMEDTDRLLERVDLQMRKLEVEEECARLDIEEEKERVKWMTRLREKVNEKVSIKGEFSDESDTNSNSASTNPELKRTIDIPENDLVEVIRSIYDDLPEIKLKEVIDELKKRLPGNVKIPNIKRLRHLMDINQLRKPRYRSSTMPSELIELIKSEFMKEPDQTLTHLRERLEMCFPKDIVLPSRPTISKILRECGLYKRHLKNSLKNNESLMLEHIRQSNSFNMESIQRDEFGNPIDLEAAEKSIIEQFYLTLLEKEKHDKPQRTKIYKYDKNMIELIKTTFKETPNATPNSVEKILRYKLHNETFIPSARTIREVLTKSGLYQSKNSHGAYPESMIAAIKEHITNDPTLVPRQIRELLCQDFPNSTRIPSSDTIAEILKRHNLFTRKRGRFSNDKGLVDYVMKLYDEDNDRSTKDIVDQLKKAMGEDALVPTRDTITNILKVNGISSSKVKKI